MKWTNYELSILEDAREVLDSGNLFDIVSELSELTSGHSYIKILFGVIYIKGLFKEVTFNISFSASWFDIDIYVGDTEVYSLGTSNGSTYKEAISNFLTSCELDSEIVKAIVENSSFVEVQSR